MTFRSRRMTIALGLALSCALAPGAGAQDDYSGLVAKGVEAAAADAGETAIAAFRDALLLKPEGREAAMNLGLALAKAGEHEEAIERFDALAKRAAGDTSLRASSLYNRGRSQLELAKAALEQQDRDAALQSALDAISSWDETLAADPSFEDAKWNRDQARHLLGKIAAMQPPPPQEDQQKGEDSKDQQQEEKQDQQQQSNQEKKDSGEEEQNEQGQETEGGGQQEGEEEKQPGDESPNEDEQQASEGEGEQEKEGGDEEKEPSDPRQDGKQGSDSEAQASPAGEGDESAMTPRQAEKVLQMLEDEQMFPVNMMRMAPALTADPEKTW